jgi:PAS domain S-box-containing protein
MAAAGRSKARNGPFRDRREPKSMTEIYKFDPSLTPNGLYRRLVEAVIDYAIYMLDPNGVVSTWNSGAQRCKGYIDSEIIGGHFSVFYTDADRESGEPGRALDQALRTGRFETEGWRVRKDGTQFWAHVIIDRITSESGETLGFAKITRDITEQMETRRALDGAREAALLQAQKMESVGQLTAGLADDFNNQIAGILGSLQLLEMRLEQGRVEGLGRYLSMAQASADRAAELTQKLLTFAHQQTLDLKPTNINQLVGEMGELLRRTTGEAIEIDVIEAARLWDIMVDPNQMATALLNLCLNARHAMPDGGRLTIATSNTWLYERAAREWDVKPGQFVTLSVSDTGTSMPRTGVEQSFDPPFTGKPLEEGLRLNRIRAFARQSGGYVRVKSEPGKVREVCLHLPRYNGFRGTGKPELDRKQVRHANDEEVILVVDDDPVIRMLVTDVSEELGYQAIEAADGANGLKMIETESRIDLLVTNFHLAGGLNGQQLAQAALAQRPQLKILFVTGHAGDALVETGELALGVQILMKPFTIEALAGRMKEALASDM